MEMERPGFPGAWGASRAVAVAGVMALSIPLIARVADGAPTAAGAVIAVTGKTVGTAKLLNPVWNEAKDPALHGFTFREPSATVRPDVRTLTAFLPEELC